LVYWDGKRGGENRVCLPIPVSLLTILLGATMLVKLYTSKRRGANRLTDY
jgi:hypothetical protein